MMKNLVTVFVVLIINISMYAQEPVQYKGKNKIVISPGDTVYEYESGKKSDTVSHTEKQLQPERVKDAIENPDNHLGRSAKREIPIEYFSSRYAFSPSGFGLKKKEGYYELSEVLINSFYYGLTDHISIGAGFLLIIPAFVSVRATFPFNDYLQFGAGYLVVPILTGGTPLQVGYASVTLGTRSANISINYGGNFDAINKLPVYTVNGFVKVSKGLGFVTENWIVSINRDQFSSFNIYSLGMRVMIKNTALDLGMMNYYPIHHSGESTYFPYFSLSFPLSGGKRHNDVK